MSSTRAVVMPKSQSTLLATDADFSCSKYTKRGSSQDGSHSGLRIVRAPPFLKTTLTTGQNLSQSGRDNTVDDVVYCIRHVVVVGSMRVALINQPMTTRCKSSHTLTSFKCFQHFRSLFCAFNFLSIWRFFIRYRLLVFICLT